MNLASEADADYGTARALLVRGLGVIFLIAFASLWPQIDGLFGSQGITPAKTFLRQVRALEMPAYWAAPTLCWLNCSDGFLHVLCALGGLGSALLILDIAPALMLAALWAAYLSFVSIGGEFLAFQWDNLLLEAGFFAIFLAPWRFLPQGKDTGVSRLALWIIRALLFKLMFSSGAVKWASGDPTWRNLTALTYHYETQPLPPWTAWYVHQAPAGFHRLSCAGVFFVELVLPWLIFWPSRRVRRGTALGLAVFQLLIMATGNYCFFNLLAILLCASLVDDAAWPAWARRALPAKTNAACPQRRQWITALAAFVFFAVSTVQVGSLLGLRGGLLRPAGLLYAAVSPFRTINNYGLFAVMTTSRREIIIEGSNDGLQWQAYEFYFKPGDVKARPSFVAPHQPRLDWQMWFAALGSYQENPWLISFCQRLLEGSPAVLRLLKRNPFPQGPPRYIRAVSTLYHFTGFAQRRAEGAWWRSSEPAIYLPAVSLKR